MDKFGDDFFAIDEVIDSVDTLSQTLRNEFEFTSLYEKNIDVLDYSPDRFFEYLEHVEKLKNEDDFNELDFESGDDFNDVLKEMQDETITDDEIKLFKILKTTPNIVIRVFKRFSSISNFVKSWHEFNTDDD
jgi:hypothetical protein